MVELELQQSAMCGAQFACRGIVRVAAVWISYYTLPVTQCKVAAVLWLPRAATCQLLRHSLWCLRICRLSVAFSCGFLAPTSVIALARRAQADGVRAMLQSLSSSLLVLHLPLMGHRWAVASCPCTCLLRLGQRDDGNDEGCAFVTPQARRIHCKIKVISFWCTIPRKQPREQRSSMHVDLLTTSLSSFGASCVHPR